MGSVHCFMLKAIPIIQGKQSLEDYYTKIWNAIYVNSANASHTKLLIPTIFHRLSLSFWPNFLLTQFLTNHSSFRSYLHKINKTPSPNCNCPEKKLYKRPVTLWQNAAFSQRTYQQYSNLFPPPLVLKYHVNTVSITSFLRNISKHFKKNPKEVKLL